MHQESQRQATVWEKPVPFHDFRPPAFPTDTLPSWARDFVEAEAIATQTPPDMVAMLVLSTVAACMAKKVEVVINDSYREPVNLFTVTAMPPGSRKMPSSPMSRHRYVTLRLKRRSDSNPKWLRLRRS